MCERPAYSAVVAYGYEAVGAGFQPAQVRAGFKPAPTFLFNLFSFLVRGLLLNPEIYGNDSIFRMATARELRANIVSLLVF